MNRNNKVFSFGDFNTSIVNVADNAVDVEMIFFNVLLFTAFQ
ncbi:hypothetical protein [Peptostreptococcus sp. D1]|nr:hypothetical protein [Peptostreptococcus sp. D1]